MSTQYSSVKAMALSQAVTVLTTGKRNKAPLTAEEVLKVAKKFAKYIITEKIANKEE